METYRTLMKDSTEQTIDLVFKHGEKLAEGSLLISAASDNLYFTGESYYQHGVWHREGRFLGKFSNMVSVGRPSP
jgi:hypothetical protein